MSSAYTKITFDDSAYGITAKKLNLLTDDLSAAIAAGGGGTGTGDMTKAIYDTNSDNIVDQAAAVPWTGITGKPSTFPPNAHASTHLAAGSDPIALATSVLAGLCPAVDNTTIQVVTSKLSCVALAWTAITGKPATFPPDSTAMLKSVYDTNSNNVVDTCDSLAWGKLTGVPATFPPDSTAMLKSVYDTNADNVVDQAAAVPWTGITGKPATFSPSAHASTHVTGGSDVIATFTSSLNGLVPASGGVAGTFLRSDGTFAAPAGGGDMLKSVYDVNNDGIVDRAAITFFTKTAAYTLTSADSGKYVICSGGSWTLSLPAPVAGLNYRLRNDMGISGTTGTITLSPTGGTIDGLASIPFLPQQECTLITDGTNWRTFGLKREVILGTQDITTSTASASVLLPVGYRYFELQFSGVVPVTNGDYIIGQFSANGGSTWITSGYYFGTMFNSTATTVIFGDNPNVANFYIVPGGQTSAASPAQSKLTIYPGNATQWASFIVDAGTRASGGPQIKWQNYGLSSGSFGPINALKYNMNTGNIANAFLTVKGIV